MSHWSPVCGGGVSSGLANVPSFALFIFWSLPLIKRSYKIYNHANICINFDRTEMYVLLALYLLLLGFRTTLCYLLVICWTFGALHHCHSDTADCSRAWFGMAQCTWRMFFPLAVGLGDCELFLTVSIKSLYSFPIKTSERNTLGIGNAIHLVLIPDLTYSTSMLELSNKVVW